MNRIAITGWPRSGKTTVFAAGLERQLGITARHTDELIASMDWSAASAAAACWFDEPGDLIIEGVAVARALRKWRAAHPDQPPPITNLIICRRPLETLTPRQAGMGKGVDTVLDEILPWLLAAGVDVTYPELHPRG